MNSSARRVELAVGFGLLALALFAAWGAARMPMGTNSLPGPGMTPLIEAILLALCAAVILKQRFKEPAGADDQIVLGHRHVGLAVLSIIGVGLLLERVGFLVTGSLFLFVLLWALSRLGWWRSLLASVLACTVALFVFRNLLNVALPRFPFSF